MSRKGLSMAVMVLLVLLRGIGSATAQEPEGDIGAQDAVGTAFTYQGRLTDGGSPANGDHDFRFRLYDVSSGGSPVSSVTKGDVTVTEGLFTVELDFGAVFDGTAFWLDIGVRPGSSSGAYTSLTPRQPLTPAPYAHTLRPGADIAGSVSGGILNISNDSVLAGDGLHIVSTTGDGVQVSSAGGFGVQVSSAGDDGVRVDSAGDDGVRVISAGGSGVQVDSAGDDGLYVGSAGSPSSTQWSTLSNGFEVAGAEEDGLYVGRADDDGVHVQSAGDDGVYVYSPGGDGVSVYSAGGNGVSVYQAGNPSGTIFSSSAKNGFQVGGAEEDGLYVGRADDDGVVVESAGGDGVVVESADGYAGFFNGAVYVTGYLTKAGGGFKIDHPLDPEDKYLYHSFVESPDMMNIYNGNVTLDASGEAWVTLPDWFEALNRDFRYQLTPIGGPGPGLYIAEKVQHNRFKIGGGEPGLEVSWQVTGIRHDPYAEANRIPVEEEKPTEERGTYLHPEAYGQPKTMGLAYKEAQAQELDSPDAGR